MRRSVLGELTRVSMSTRLVTPTMDPIAAYRCWDRDAPHRCMPDHQWRRVLVASEKLLTKL